MSEKDAKKEAMEILRNARYGEDGEGYFWIDGTDYTLLMHPILSEQEGTNRYDLKEWCKDHSEHYEIGRSRRRIQ